VHFQLLRHPAHQLTKIPKFLTLPALIGFRCVHNSGCVGPSQPSLQEFGAQAGFSCPVAVREHAPVLLLLDRSHQHFTRLGKPPGVAIHRLGQGLEAIDERFRGAHRTGARRRGLTAAEPGAPGGEGLQPAGSPWSRQPFQQRRPSAGWNSSAGCPGQGMLWKQCPSPMTNPHQQHTP
jgi:hypothetical protein